MADLDTPQWILISAPIVICERATTPQSLVATGATLCPFCGRPIAEHRQFNSMKAQAP